MEDSIQRRIVQAKKLAVGTIAPSFILPNLYGSNIELSNINSDKLLLIFYASWYTHCQELLSKISESYKDLKNKNQLEVVAISLDTEKEDWQNFIEENKLEWINLSDFKGWDGKVTADYFIYATPTMFLLDKENFSKTNHIK